MLSITKVNNSIKVEGLDNKQFPDNGTLMIPLNSVILTLDESNIATFRSAANNDVLFSGVITDIQISGTPMTKQTITTAFTNVANSSGGGGGTVDAYTKAETDALLATKANESELSDYATVESLATVATSGDYDDLSNKPTIPVVPTDVSAFNNDAGYITQEEVIINEAFPNGWHTTGTMADIIADINADTDAVPGKVYMNTVSFSDLPANMQQAELKAEIISQLGNSKVIVFTVTSSEVSPYHWEYTSAYGQTNSWREWVTPAAMQSALSVKANSADLATVATTGSYNDLTNKPTIPAAQIQSDWNQSDNSAADYIKNKPVNVSAFTNDAGYLTQHQSLADYSTTQEMNTAIATATNDMATMTWVGEQGYLTQHQDISDLFNGAEYDTQTKRINFKHGNTVLAYIDATAFIKDGMVSNVEVKNVTISGETVLCLVITFNTDAGKEPINIPISSIFDASNYYTKTETDNTFVKPADLATVATSGDYTDLSNTPNLATVATTGDYDDLSNKPTIPAAQVQSDWNEADTTSKAYIQNKPTIPTVPTNVSAFTNDAGYTTNTGTITGITMNGTSKGTSGVVDLGTVITEHQSLEGYVQDTDLATVATTGDYADLTNKPVIPAAQVQSDWNQSDNSSVDFIKNKPTLATVATTGDYDDLTNKPTIPTVPTNVSAFTNDAGYTTNTGTITGITMNGVSKGTSGVVDLGTVITDISGKQDVIDSSHKLDADLVDDTTSTNKFVTASDKTTWNGKQDELVSGTSIKTINNESILGSGNITVSGGSSYTAGDNIDITNDVISVDIDDEKKVIASALTELHNDKADKSQLHNYQFKGDYATRTEVTEGLSLKANVTALSDYRTEVEAINVEKVNAAALNDLDARVSTLEQGGGGSGITGITMNGSAVTVTSGVANLGTVVTDVSGKQDALVSGTNIKTINNESILGSGNITIEGGGGISGITMNGSPVTVTSGVADLGTVVTDVSGKQDAMNIVSPLSYNKNNKILSLDISIDKGNSGEGNFKMNGKPNYLNNVTGNYSVALGTNNTVSGKYSAAIGGFDIYGAGSTVSGSSSIALGRSHNIAKNTATATGQGHTISNDYETAVGRYSQSNHSTDTFGDSGNTLFAVGNGTSNSARSNAFEVRQNGDIYISNSDHTQTIKLQDNLGGGGGGITGITMNGSAVTVTSGVANLGTVVTDKSDKQDVIDSSHKLSADLVDDTNTTNKFVTASDKTTWGAKQDALVSGTNIKTINNESILGSGNITIQGGGGITGITMNGSPVTVTSGVADLGTVITEHQSLSNYYTKTEIDAMIGNISSSLDTINGEVI